MSISQNFPTDLPTLNLDFVNNQFLDPRITFTRTSSATYFNSSGVLTTAANNVPRFDYDPATFVSRGLLIEGQKTNLLTYSDFSLNSFTSNVILTANSTTSPDGTVNATLLTANVNGSSNDCQVDRNATVASNTTHTFSVFLKAGTSPISTVNLYYTAGTFRQSVGTITWSNLNYTVTSTDSTATGTITNSGNGWYRLTLTYGSGNNTTCTSRVYVRDQGSNNVIGHTVYVWGRQTEVGFSATSYIPTAAATVTRIAETATMTGTNFSSWFNLLEGTLYVESSSAMANASFPRYVTISDNSINNSIRISGSGDTLFGGGRVDAGGAAQAALLLSPVLPNIKYKHALAYKANDFAYIANSTTSITHDALGTVPTVDRIHIGSDNYGEQLNGYVLKVSYYPSRLSNTQLTALTRT